MSGEIMSVYKSKREGSQLAWSGFRLWGFHFGRGRLGLPVALSTVWGVPTGHCSCELGEQEGSTRQCLPQPVREVLQILSTLYPSMCHLRGVCVWEQGWQQNLGVQVSYGQEPEQGSQPKLAASPWLLNHGCVALLHGSVEKEEERRKYHWHTWAGSGHVPAGLLQH